MTIDNDNLLLKIRRHMPYLNPALKKIAKYMLKNPDEVKLLKINELATKCKVSEATVTRFVKELDIKSFQELKIAMAGISSTDHPNVTTEDKYVYEDVTKNDSIESIIEKIVFRNVEALRNIKSSINPLEIDKAVSAIDRANTIVIYCVGISNIAAQSAKMRFYRIGKRFIVYNDPAQQAVSSSLLDENCVAIGISASGISKPTVNALKMAKQSGATTICVTNSDNSPLIKLSDIKLIAFAEESSFFQESLVSRIVQLLILDILYASYAVKHYEKSLESIDKSAEALRKFLR